MFNTNDAILNDIRMNFLNSLKSGIEGKLSPMLDDVMIKLLRFEDLYELHHIISIELMT